MLDTTSPMIVATQSMSTTTFEPRPASDIEIVAIAAATCILALFLSVLLYRGARSLCSASSGTLDVGDDPSITMLPDKGSKTTRSIARWATISLGQLRIRYLGERMFSRTSSLASLDCEAQTKNSEKSPAVEKKYFHTQAQMRFKPVSRKPLWIVKSPLSSGGRDSTIFDLEEGLGWEHTAFAETSSSRDEYPPLAACDEWKPRIGDHSGGSFLHRSTASLG
ncbi:hypothetical protein GGS21DRAFT_491949 [Xylaria nigripes]|nr:hypothetical protein GGS21DRAFT_491949 [Xylaria nigripes]